jgi:hypothetical protein
VVIARMPFEVARVRARAERRSLPPCIVCRATHISVLGKGTDPSLCYRHRVRDREGHHPKTHHVGPEIPGTDTNEHRVVSEIEGIWDRIRESGMCTECEVGCNRVLTVWIMRLGSLGDAA